ncbi:MAG: hypothetical protein MRJ93_14985 [Nitrososphaeraceae archaeon]|nr:hypothetical protein [Nitrososphaeraceae archaeon]
MISDCSINEILEQNDYATFNGQNSWLRYEEITNKKDWMGKCSLFTEFLLLQSSYPTQYAIIIDKLILIVVLVYIGNRFTYQHG